jgi:hypothetical protein
MKQERVSSVVLRFCCFHVQGSARPVCFERVLNFGIICLIFKLFVLILGFFVDNICILVMMSRLDGKVQDVQLTRCIASSVVVLSTSSISA